jgi:hypothetical protein
MVIGFITAFGLIAVGLIVLMVYAMLQGGFSSPTGSFGMKLVNSQNVNMSGIDSIRVSYTHADVTFYESDTNEIIFKEYMNFTPEDDELSRIDVSGSELNIESGRHRTNIFTWPFSHNSHVEIYLPSDYAGKLKVKTSSGNINTDPVLKLAKFTVESTSGNIKVNEVYSESISADASSGNISFKFADGKRRFTATSGNIRVEGGSGDTELSTSSGNITVENASGHLDVEASSGEIRSINCSGGGSFDASSGNITLEFISLSENLDVHVSSGNINLTVPEEAAFNFDAKTSSGSIHTFFDDQLSYNKRGNNASGTVGENPTIDINLDATSGNVRVND